MEVVCVVLLVAVTAAAREYTDANLSSFPRLFHLDDYERCLSRPDALYCLGTFDLTPRVQPHHIYQLLKEYSEESYRHFNRTRVHRGYCVTSRCPQEAVRNASQRFERCVDEWARTRALRASVNTFHYCHTHADKYAERRITPAQQLFLQCVCAIVALNVIATFYDIVTGDDVKKNTLISAFSIPSNWRRLTVIQEGGDPRLAALAPLNGIRVLALVCSTYVHANIIHYVFHTLNPEFLEKQTEGLYTTIMSNGTALMQALVMMSCFLTGYNLLMLSQKRALSLFLLPLTLPVSLLIVGFGATWWVHIRKGPLVSSTIGLESRTCRTKFWSQMFYINNMVEPTEYCILPTWFLAVNMHMHIVASIFTLIMWRHRRKAVKIYLALFFASCALIAIVAYRNNYKSMVFISIPEAIRRTFRDTPSVTELYISSWGALPSCFLGLILAQIQFEVEERRIKLSEHKWFVYLHICTVPLNILWLSAGEFARNQRSPIFHVLHVTFDKPIFCILFAISLLGMINIDSPLRRFFSWSGFSRLSPLSLTVMLLHWCVNMVISARPVAYNTSILDMVVDWLSTYCITYLLAVPIILLVEMPMQKLLGQLFL